MGQTDDDGFTYDPKTQLASVAATDGTRVLAAFDGVEQSPVGAGESAAQRVSRIADMAGWPVAQRDISPGGVAVQATTLAEAAWTMLLAVADTDLALLWINRAGQLAFRPEGRVTPSRKVGTIIGCGPDDPANLLDPQTASLEDGTTTGWYATSNVSLANTTAQAALGSHSLAMTAIADGDVLPLQLPSSPVVAGQAYDITGTFRAASQSRNCFMYWYWYDAGNNYIGAGGANVIKPDSATSWTVITETGRVAPAGAASIGLIPYVQSCLAGETHYVDALRVALAGVAPTIVISPVNITGQQPTITRNIVSVSRQARDSDDTPVTVTVRDDPSVARFLAHSYSRTDLIHNDDSWSATVAQAVLMGSAWPSTSPASVDLSSRADPAATALLLSLEPSLSIDVTDGVNTWECEPVGWQVVITRNEVSGTISLVDVSAWYGAAWDDTSTDDGWDLSSWGF